MHGIEIYDASANRVFSSNFKVMKVATNFNVSASDPSNANPIYSQPLALSGVLSPLGINFTRTDIMMRPATPGHFFGISSLQNGNYPSEIPNGPPYLWYSPQNGGTMNVVVFSESGGDSSWAGEYGLRMFGETTNIISENDDLFMFDAIITYVNPSVLYDRWASPATYLTTINLPAPPLGFKRYFSIYSPMLRGSGGLDKQLACKYINDTSIEIYSHVYGLSGSNGGPLRSVPQKTHYIYTGYCRA